MAVAEPPCRSGLFRHGRGSGQTQSLEHTPRAPSVEVGRSWRITPGRCCGPTVPGSAGVDGPCAHPSGLPAVAPGRRAGREIGSRSGEPLAMDQDFLSLVPAREGHFRLESGHHGRLWFDLETLFVDPVRLAPFVDALAEKLRAHDVRAVCGPLVGGAFLAQALAVALCTEFWFTERVIPPGAPRPLPGRVPPPSELAGPSRGETCRHRRRRHQRRFRPCGGRMPSSGPGVPTPWWSRRSWRWAPWA